MNYYAARRDSVSGRQVEEDVNFHTLVELVGEIKKKPSQAHILALSHQRKLADLYHYWSRQTNTGKTACGLPNIKDESARGGSHEGSTCTIRAIGKLLEDAEKRSLALNIGAIKSAIMALLRCQVTKCHKASKISTANHAQWITSNFRSG